MTALNPPQAASGQRAARVSEAEPEPGPQPHAPARSAGWRPWHGRPRARDLACALAIAVSAVYALAMIPLTPALIATRPVLLEMLSGSNSAIVAAGAFSDIDSKLQLAVVVSAALPGMLRFDWVIWWAGRLWGHRIVAKLGAHSPRTAAMAAAAERRGTRFARPRGAVLGLPAHLGGARLRGRRLGRPAAHPVHDPGCDRLRRLGRAAGHRRLPARPGRSAGGRPRLAIRAGDRGGAGAAGRRAACLACLAQPGPRPLRGAAGSGRDQPDRAGRRHGDGRSGCCRREPTASAGHHGREGPGRDGAEGRPGRAGGRAGGART